ncbi:hypothetical protein CSAL01_02282 [Colletotrichum salicis]|uniref:Rhodopsin domain-containing protein n=1 Tax=Colletotrichum salicis TaxID=1209931 RepID=A0A135U1E3_9PEZI|nr:hypothetical protein CSAL01_02282 [Colletotrichum salicis]
MSVMVVVAILALIFVFANCTPLVATWNPALGSCQKKISLQNVSYIVSAIQMLTDWACAIVPFFIVAGLQMSRRKKVSVIAILGLGIFASIATCIRMPYLKYYDTAKYPTEIAYHLGVISITSNLECSLGIIGSSLPPLRKLFKFYYGSSHDGNYKITGESGDALSSAGPGIKLGSLSGNDRTYHESSKRCTSRSGAREHETDDDDSSSRKGIIRKTDIHPLSVFTCRQVSTFANLQLPSLIRECMFRKKYQHRLEEKKDVGSLSFHGNTKRTANIWQDGAESSRKPGVRE